MMLGQGWERAAQAGSQYLRQTQSCHRSRRTSPWNLYYRVTIVDAIELGLLKVINSVQKTKFTPDQFAAIYIDERNGEDLWLRALFTCRTEDWHFLKTVLFAFLRELRSVQAVGDETGLGKQICWEARYHFGGRFQAVNFSSKKHDIGFSLMNQLSVAQKRFPKSHQDIAADYFALRKSYHGTRWVFSEGPNTTNPASHCDIAWAGALATEAHVNHRCEVWALVD